MLSTIVSGFQRFKDWWWGLNLFWRVVSPVAVLAGLYFVIAWVPAVPAIKEWYARANPETQLMFLLAGLVALLIMTIVTVNGWHHVNQLETKAAEAEKARASAAADAAQLQERWDKLLNAGCHDELWKRPPGIIPPGFQPKSVRTGRKTRFLTVLNFKGGVGKTTLTTNIAACLAQDPSKPLRVLLIDIDFQGTLSRATVDRVVAGVQVDNNNLVNRLLTTAEPEPGLVGKIGTPMTGTKDCRVIMADEKLDPTEFQVQAQFFVKASDDPRFRFRLHLHRPEVFDAFDLVMFDCPPRVTASVVNAVACSDYILIPTKLDTGSVNAVPRTLAWMKSLGEICPAEVLGVIASHANTSLAGDFYKADSEAYAYLREVIESSGEDRKLLFKAAVRSSTKAVNGDKELASKTAEGRKVFAAVVKELRERMGL